MTSESVIGSGGGGGSGDGDGGGMKREMVNVVMRMMGMMMIDLTHEGQAELARRGKMT